MPPQVFFFAIIVDLSQEELILLTEREALTASVILETQYCHTHTHTLVCKLRLLPAATSAFLSQNIKLTIWKSNLLSKQQRVNKRKRGRMERVKDGQGRLAADQT